MLLKIVFTLIAAFIFLYFFWKRLREDYTQNQIFTSGFYILIGIMVGIIIADNFAPSFWFWLSFVGFACGLFLGIARFRLRVFETFEAAVLSGLSLVIIAFLYNFSRTRELTTLIATIIVAGLVIIFILFDKHYKKFTWYKSGKVGFSGLTVCGIFFLIRCIVALARVSVLSFVGIQDALISGILAFISFLMVFNLSRQSV